MASKKELIPTNTFESPHLKVKIRELNFLQRTEHRPVIDNAHRDNYFVILFQQKGKSRLLVDFEEVNLEDCCIFFLLPGQVHHYLEYQIQKGWLVAIDPSMIETSIRQILEEEVFVQIPVTVPADFIAPLENLLMVVSAVMDRKILTVLQSEVVHHLISSYAALIAGIYQSGTEKIPQTISRPMEITRQFRKLVKQHIRFKKQPQEYSELMNLSLTYLNECVKRVTGKPVSHWIVQEIVLEAKRSLIYTTKSIKELSFELGYPDQAYFAKLFKKNCGLTPAVFRSKNRV